MYNVGFTDQLKTIVNFELRNRNYARKLILQLGRSLSALEPK